MNRITLVERLLRRTERRHRVAVVRGIEHVGAAARRADVDRRTHAMTATRPAALRVHLPQDGGRR